MSTHTAVGTTRRLQGLAVMGWDLGAVAARTGLTEADLGAARAGELAMGPSADAVIARAYRTLVALPGPDGALRAWAREQAWHSPLAWEAPDDEAALPERPTAPRGDQEVDQFAIDRALALRDGRDLNRAERLAAAILLGMPNSPNSVISTKLGLSTTVAKSLRATLEAMPQAAPAA